MREPPFQTRISVPSDDVEHLMDALSEAGFVVLDTGERITTEGALEGEATLELLDLPAGDALEAVDDAQETQETPDPT